MTNDVLYFPSVRVAFNKTTATIDQLIEEADRSNNIEASKAYKACFGLIRQAVQQIENQGESSLHKYLEDEIEAVLKIPHDNCQKIKYSIENEFRESLKAVTDGIISILQKKNLSDEYINESKKEIETYALEEVTNIFSEEGIGFSE